MVTKVQILLLLFGLRFSSGRELTKIELSNGTDTYEVKELPNNTIEFLDPKPGEPTVREITYYRVVEKPYDEVSKHRDSEEDSASDDGPDFDQTRRPFTNAQGLQFADWGEIDDDGPESNSIEAKASTKNNGTADDNSNSKVNNDSPENYDGESQKNNGNDDDKNYNDYSDEKTNDAGKIDANKKKNHSNSDVNKSIENDKNGDDYENNSAAIKDYQMDYEKSNEEKDTTTTTTTEKTKKNNETDDTINKASNLRNQLFNSAKVKYHSIRQNNSTSHQRRKREVDYKNIPEAPKLPDMDISSFPKYIQRMLSNKQTIAPMTDNKDRDDDYNDISSDYSPEERNDEGNYNRNKPQTYEMNIKKERGYSWNHIPHTQNDLNQNGHNTHHANPAMIHHRPIANAIHIHTPDQQNNPKNNKEEKSAEENKERVVYGGYMSPNEEDKDDRQYNKNNEDPQLMNNKIPDSNNIESIQLSRNDEANSGIEDEIKDMFDNIDGKFMPPDGRKPKTYGMELKGDKGKFWNDIAGTPSFETHDLHKNKPILQTKNSDEPNKETANSNKNQISENNEPSNINQYSEENTKPSNDKEQTLPSTETSAENNQNKNQTSNTSQPLKPAESQQFGPRIAITSTQSPVISSTPYVTMPNIETNPTIAPESDFMPEVTKAYLDDPFEEKKFEDKMAKSFNNIIAKLTSSEPTTNNPNPVIDFNNLENNQYDDDEPKTYGMNLEGNHGYTWNDLSNPGVHINVGTPEFYDSIEQEKSKIPEKPANEPFESYTETSNNNNISDDDVTTERNTTESNTTKEESNTPNEHNNDNLPVDNESDDDIEVKKPRKNTDNKDTTDNNIGLKPFKDYSNTDHDRKKPNTNKEDNEDSKIKMTLDDLLKKDEFWKWLSKWTAAYTEVLRENIKKLVKSEVASEMEKYSKERNNLNKDKDVVNKDDKHVDNKHIDNKNATQKHYKNIKHIANTTNDNRNATLTIDKSKKSIGNMSHINANITINLNPKRNLSSDHDDLTKNKDEINEKGSESKHSTVDKDKMTKIMNKNNNTSKLNVSSKVIYGNAVGNDHVTNIFIFFPSNETENTMHSLDKLINVDNPNGMISKEPSDTSSKETGGDDSYIPLTHDKDLISIKNKTSNANTSATESTTPTPVASTESVKSTTNKNISMEANNNTTITTTQNPTTPISTTIKTIATHSVKAAVKTTTEASQIKNTATSNVNTTKNATTESSITASNKTTTEAPKNNNATNLTKTNSTNSSTIKSTKTTTRKNISTKANNNTIITTARTPTAPISTTIKTIATTHPVKAAVKTTTEASKIKNTTNSNVKTTKNATTESSITASNKTTTEATKNNNATNSTKIKSTNSSTTKTTNTTNIKNTTIATNTKLNAKTKSNVTAVTPKASDAKIDSKSNNTVKGISIKSVTTTAKPVAIVKKG